MNRPARYWVTYGGQFSVPRYHRPNACRWAGPHDYQGAGTGSYGRYETALPDGAMPCRKCFPRLGGKRAQ